MENKNDYKDLQHIQAAYGKTFSSAPLPYCSLAKTLPEMVKYSGEG